MGDHQLGAVLFTDIIGYSSQMASDEAKTLAALKRNKESHQKFISQFNGRIIDVIGDGHLCFFKSSLDAVYAGLALQNNLQNSKDETQLRIGIHVGDTVIERRLFSADLIIGDTVNIASRIESNAPGSGVWVSGRVAGDLRNHSFLKLRSAGVFPLKNIPEAMEIIEVSADMSDLPHFQPDNKKFNQKPILTRTAALLIGLVSLVSAAGTFVAFQAFDKPESLAVLPLEYVGANSDLQYLATSFWKRMQTDLSAVDTVKIASQANARRLTESGEYIGNAEVDYFIEGTIFLENQQVMLEIHIVEADSDAIIFTKQWQVSLDEIDAMEHQAIADIALYLANEL